MIKPFDLNPINRIYGKVGAVVPVVADEDKPDETDYLCFTAEQANSTISMTNNGDNAPVIYWSTDKANWNLWDFSAISLANIGDKVYMYGVNESIGKSTSIYSSFSMTGKIAASGNIQTLLTKDGSSTSVSNYCYYQLFYGCTSLTTAPELPATTLADYCYRGMFRECTSLITAPELPATTLSTYCYYTMFGGCTSLTTAPELPATTLASNCYSNMFEGCTSLTTAPELPATTLASNCYKSMFQGCTSLTTAPELPATTLATHCYDTMFRGCTSLTTAPELPATTLATYCYSCMFQECTSLTIAPELPATTLAQNCYSQMFQGCTSLNYIKIGATTWNTSYVFNWVYNVSATGDFYCPSSLSISTGTTGIPTGWTKHDVSDE